MTRGDAVTGSRARLDSSSAEPFARLALESVAREYPNQVAHVLRSDADVRPPRDLTPAFFGAYDWHSAVHGHWTLARLARLFPDAPFARDARSALARSLARERIDGEVRYLEGEGREGFERPYGLAWLLTLAFELTEWGAAEAREWAGALAPLAALARARLLDWLPKLTHPIRSGEHSQTAFAMGLALDASRGTGDGAFAALLASRARAFHLADRNGPIDYEPSGHDFLSPCLAEADLLRRVLPPGEFARWLDGFLPGIPTGTEPVWPEPAIVADAADGKLAHLHGLNLSRAWMLEGIAAGLPDGDARRPVLLRSAGVHACRAWAAFAGRNYAVDHWLGTFAVYLSTGRGVP